MFISLVKKYILLNENELKCNIVIGYIKVLEEGPSLHKNSFKYLWNKLKVKFVESIKTHQRMTCINTFLKQFPDQAIKIFERENLSKILISACLNI